MRFRYLKKFVISSTIQLAVRQVISQKWIGWIILFFQLYDRNEIFILLLILVKVLMKYCGGEYRELF